MGNPTLPTADGFFSTLLGPCCSLLAGSVGLQARLERGEINERQHKGLLYVRERGAIQRREYAQLTGASERTAARDLADLVERNLLERSGGRGRSTAYRLRETGGT